MAKKNDPLYVTWFRRNEAGRLEEVDIFKFIASQMGATTYLWNKVGLGSVIFKKGTLKIADFGETTAKNDYEAMWFELDLRKVQEATSRKTDFVGGLNLLYSILSDKNRLLELEKKAYRYMIDLLQGYMGRRGGLIMGSQYRSSPIFSATKKKSRRLKPWSDNFRLKNRNYTGQWTHLINDIVLNRNPKTAGGGVYSFTLEDLLKVQLASTNSPLKSIFMMEEFGTGLFADKELRRPFLDKATTPFKVPPEIANQFNTPEAIYMWFPFPNFLVKAKLLYLNKLKGASAVRFLKELHKSHKRMSLSDYRKEAYDRIKKYNAEGSLTNPLAWAYGRGAKGIGHPGREARHLFFDRNGIVQSIRLIQVAGYYRLLQLIDAEIKDAVPGFSSIADIVFPEGQNFQI